MPTHGKRKKKSLAMKAYKIAKKLQSAQEIKFFDRILLQANIDWNGVGPDNLNDMDQGIADNERIGDKVHCTSVRARFWVDENNSGCAGLRLIVLWDKKNTLGGIGDILLIGSPNSLTSDYNVDNRADYTILFDKIINVDGTNKVRQTGMFRKKLGKDTQFLNGGTVHEKGALKAYYISDTSNVALVKPFIRINYRCFYSDS